LAATLAFFRKSGPKIGLQKQAASLAGSSFQDGDPIEDQKLYGCITSGKTLQTKELR